MLKFSLTLPIVLSSLYVSFSQAQYDIPSCVVSCAQTAAYQAGCNPCVPSSTRIYRVPILPDPPRCRSDPACVCTNDAFIGAASSCLWQSCSDSDVQTAVDYWAIVCGGYGPSSGTGNHSPSIIDLSFIDNSNRKCTHGDPLKLCPTFLLAKVGVQLIRN